MRTGAPPIHRVMYRVAEACVETRVVFKALSVSLMLTTAGCGVSYFSPEIGDNVAEDAPVSVVALNASAIKQANASTYIPKQLPAAFFQAAGGGSTVAGLGALPAEPFLPSESPERLDFRPLPDIQPEPYRIGVSDVLLLATTSTASTIEQLSGLLAAQQNRQGYTVRDDGTISIPEVGVVSVEGLTINEAEDTLFEFLVNNQITPSFSLEVAEFNSQKVAVGGSVQRAGLIPVTLTPLSLSDAITSAGGISARGEQFVAIRIYRDGTLYEIPAEMYRARQDLQDKLLQNGDAVFVDNTYDLDRALEFYRSRLDVISLRSSARSQALNALSTEINLRRAALTEKRAIFEAREALDAVDRDYVYLAGEVKNQGRFPLPFDRQATLADVLYSEGGFDTTTGNPSEIYVLRAVQEYSDEVTAFHLDAKNAANLVLATKLQMRPNDIVFIEEQPITKWNRSLQQLFPILATGALDAARGQ